MPVTSPAFYPSFSFLMAKMAELDAEIRRLFNPGQLFPPTREDYDAAAALITCIRKYREVAVHPDQTSIL